MPNLDATLRVNGRARITTDAALMQRLAIDGTVPTCALWVEVQQVFFQCGKSMMRSRLWQAQPADAPGPPSPAQILAALTAGEVDATHYDREKPARLRSTLS